MRRLLLAVVVLVGMGVAVPVLPAAAHGETGFFALVEAEPIGTSDVHYVVTLRYEGDRDVVTDASVTLTASGPDGVGLGPMPMNGGPEGRYEATVTFPGPGVWGVRIESVEPAAVLEQTQTVGAPTTTVTSTTVAPSTTSTPTVPASSEGDDEGGGVRPASVVAVGVAALAIAFVLRRQRDRQREATRS